MNKKTESVKLIYSLLLLSVFLTPPTSQTRTHTRTHTRTLSQANINSPDTRLSSKNDQNLELIKMKLAKNGFAHSRLSLDQRSQFTSPAEALKAQSQNQNTANILAGNTLKNNRVKYHRYLEKKMFHPLTDPRKPALKPKLFTLAFSLVLLLIIFTCFFIKHFFGDRLDSDVQKRFQKMTRELMILMLLVSVLKLIDYFRILKSAEDKILLSDIQLLLSEFTIVYIILNFVYIIYGSYLIRQWKDKELRVPEQVQLYREYEILFLKIQEGNCLKADQQQYWRLVQLMKYFILRQEFISPTFVCQIKEQVLRHDFDFSRYLAKSYFSVLDKTLNLSISTLFSFFLFFVSYVLIRVKTDEEWEIYVMCLFAGLAFMFNLVVYAKSKWINNQLTHPLYTPYEFSLQAFEATRNPFTNQDKVFEPAYLEIFYKSMSVKGKQIYNCHEALFWFCSPLFTIKLTHINMVVQVLWMILFYSNYYKELGRSLLNLGLAVFSTFLAFFSVFVMTPKVMRIVTVISNIEMLKNKERMDEVVMEQKAQTSKVFAKMYRLIKMIRRDFMRDHFEALSQESGVQFVELIIKLVRETFNKIDKDKTGLIKIKDLIPLSRMLGKQFQNEEMFYLVQKVKSKVQQEIDEARMNQAPSIDELSYSQGQEANFEKEQVTFFHVMDSLEEFQEESSWMPTQICSSVFGQTLKSNNPVSVTEIEKMLRSFDVFTQQEVHLVLNEIRFLQSVQYSISTDEISLLIRDLVEQLPK